MCRENVFSRCNRGRVAGCLYRVGRNVIKHFEGWGMGVDWYDGCTGSQTMQ